MKKLDLFQRASINFQSAVSKLTRIRSNSLISSHATSTIKRGKDLSSSTIGRNTYRDDLEDLRKEVDHSVKFVSETIQQNTNKVSGWMRRTTHESKLIKST